MTDTPETIRKTDHAERKSTPSASCFCEHEIVTTAAKFLDIDDPDVPAKLVNQRDLELGGDANGMVTGAPGVVEGIVNIHASFTQATNTWHKFILPT